MRRTLTPSVRTLLVFSFAIASSACSAESAKNQGSGSGGATGQGSGGANVGTGGAGSGGSGGAGAVDAATGDGPGGLGSGGASAGPDAGGGDMTSAGGRNLTANRDLFLGASRCAQAGVMLCEDFESGTLDPATWTVALLGAGTAPTIDTMQAARGTHALHITTTGGPARSAISEVKTFMNAVNDTYFGRAFFYFKTIPTPPVQAFSHFDLVAAIGTGMRGETKVFSMTKNNQQVFGVGTDGMGDMGVGEWSLYDNDPAGAPKPVPTGQWVCLEWEHNGDLKETHFWWDGVAHPSLDTSTIKNGTGGKPYVLPKYNQVFIGWHEWQNSTVKAELWVDEIAIDKERIGCVL